LSTVLNRSLAELEEQSRAGTWPVLVDGLPLHPGGVDPLGLRQLNFDLMDDVIPGLNNVASRLRVYVLLAWAWWKAAELSRAEGKSQESADRLLAFVDRMEVLFAVSHLVNNDFVSLLGRDTLNARVVRPGGFDFTGTGWAKFRKDRALISSFMAPVAYGPSAKVGLGLGVLALSDAGTFAPVTEVVPAVLAFEKQLKPILDEPAFAELDGGYVSVDDMRRYYEFWRAGDVTEVEVQAGRERLYDKRSAVPRRHTVDLIRHLLETAAHPLAVEEIRRALGSGMLHGHAVTPPDHLIETAQAWRALMARQLLRLSLESLLTWVLAECAVPSSAHALGDRLFNAVGRPNYANVSEWLVSEAWNVELADPVTNPVELMEQLEEERQANHPELAIDGIKAALAIARAASNRESYQGQPDRLPLDRLLARVDKMAELAFDEALEVIVSEWVIGQHIYWAVGRSGDDTQRLRLMLDEGGWLSFYANPGNARATADRLQTLLRLMSDCALCEEIVEGDLRRYAWKTTAGG
jgi:hypothetical protein